MRHTRPLCTAIVICIQLISANTQAASYGSGKWNEKNNRIQLNTVCANHDYGSIKSRKCRAELSKHFNKKCKHFKKKYSASSSKNRTKYKNGKTKYCYAARHFKIVE